MRTLLLLRGAPGCGKSTWIKEHDLSDYVLSADNIRLMFASPQMTVGGDWTISQGNDRMVWETLFKMLEWRMQNGDFTVIDACNSKTSEMTRYRDLAAEYRYRIFCVDMTNVPIEVAKERNAKRPPLKRVPEEVIDRMYARFATQNIPAGIKAIKPDELYNKVYAQLYNLNEYKYVMHIGDIHGCYDALMKALGVKDGEDPASALRDDTEYIFLGDYIDRGPDSAKVIKFLLDIYQKPNVCLLEGNHERHLWDWANDRRSRSKDFEVRTRPQLEAAGIDKKDVRCLYRKMRQCSMYMFHGKTVLCTHGGLPFPRDITRADFIPAYQMIHGVGKYEEMEEVAKTFKHAPHTMMQVFGHRNVNGRPMRIEDNNYCLDNHVERGGKLRCMRMSLRDDAGAFRSFCIEGIEVDGPEYEETVDDGNVEAVESPESVSIAELVEKMRSSKLINEKKFSHISSFNFSRKAFADKKWNDLTTKARGLFIDTTNMRIVARGYDKFFAIGERPETELHTVADHLMYPVDVYIKENGFLGMVAWDNATNTLFTTTKSTPDGDMAMLFRSKLPDWQKERMSEYLREHDVTLLFEVIDPANDPHIISYPKDGIVLLDAVSNTLTPSYMAYEDLVELARNLGVEVKQRYIPSKAYTAGGFKAIVNDIANIDTDSVEGVVFRDANGYMLKQKTEFYSEWKKLRKVKDMTLTQGYIRQTSVLATPMENYFYAFVKSLYKKEGIATDIISMRKAFFEAYPQFNTREDTNDQN